MASSLKTAVLVSIITFLIWLWAEGESLSTLDRTARVEFVSSPDLLVEPEPAWRGAAKLRVQGSRHAIEQAEQVLLSPIQLQPGQHGVPSTPGPDQALNLLEAIRSAPELSKLGVSVAEVEPAAIRVSLIKIVTRTLPVVVDKPTEIDFADEPRVSPDAAEVRLSEPDAARLPENPVARAVISPDAVRGLAAGIPHTLTVPLLMPPGVTVIAAPDKATVTFRLRRTVEQETLATVPVWLKIPPTEGERWNIALEDQYLRDVTLTGPSDAILRIRDRAVVVIAEVALTSDDLERGITEARADIPGLPPGVEFSAPTRTVRLRITPRKAAEDAAAAPDPSP